MRILHVSSLYPPEIVGGAELGVRTMAEAMADAGHDVHVVTLCRRSGHPPRHDADDGRVTVHRLPLLNLYWPFVAGGEKRSVLSRAVWHAADTANLPMAAGVRRIARRVEPDVVLTHNLQGFSTAVIPALASTGTAVVHVPHDCALLCPQTTMWRNGRGCGSQSDRCTSCRLLTARRRSHAESVSGVISVSAALLNLHVAHGFWRDIPKTVIHNALRPTFRIVPGVRHRSTEQPLTFGFLGRVERVKGVETLLSAAARLRASGARLRLLIAGRVDPEYRRWLSESWPLDDVEFLGFVDAAEFFSRIDVLVFPSEWQEALGNGVFEAFSQGVPVIGSRVGGIPESIDHGINGYLFEPGEVNELAGRMSCLLADPARWRRMAEAALVKSKEYRAPHRCGQYIAFLETLLSGRQERAGA